MTDGKPQLRLYNTLTRAKEAFAPIDANNVRMYVCGPTVYDYAHIGNARPAIVFDVLFRLLRHLYGEDHVTYVRNITDVDDKINARALRDFPGLPLNEAIRKVTEPTYEQYQKDVTALGCLAPTHQPRATDFVVARDDGKPDMISMIQSLIDRGHAYEAKGESGREVLFDTRSMADYGQLSKRNLDEQQAGARVAVEAHKKNPSDFVLWKESSADEPGWEATYRVEGKDIAIRGRPGWHIECSAMSAAYLGNVFDIHGGGLDLIFPHHENEIAQSRCAHGSDVMANVWMHNGFLQVEGKKMSKSDGNFVTIHDLLETGKFGTRPWQGRVLRLSMLTTHYREPIDWSVRNLTQARKEMFLFSDALRQANRVTEGSGFVDEELVSILADDVDTGGAIMYLAKLRDGAKRSDLDARRLRFGLKFLGIMDESCLEFYDYGYLIETGLSFDNANEVAIAAERYRVAQANNSAQLSAQVSNDFADWDARIVEIKPGLLSIHRLATAGIEKRFDKQVQERIDERLALIAEKNWVEADRIRDELLEQGIQLKDGKDPETGERTTTWEVKR